MCLDSLYMSIKKSNVITSSSFTAEFHALLLYKREIREDSVSTASALFIPIDPAYHRLYTFHRLWNWTCLFIGAYVSKLGANVVLSKFFWTPIRYRRFQRCAASWRFHASYTMNHLDVECNKLSITQMKICWIHAKLIWLCAIESLNI